VRWITPLLLASCVTAPTPAADRGPASAEEAGGERHAQVLLGISEHAFSYLEILDLDGRRSASVKSRERGRVRELGNVRDIAEAEALSRGAGFEPAAATWDAGPLVREVTVGGRRYDLATSLEDGRAVARLKAAGPTDRVLELAEATVVGAGRVGAIALLRAGGAAVWSVGSTDRLVAVDRLVLLDLRRGAAAIDEANGLALLAAGELTPARDAFAASLAIDEGYGNARYNLACAEARLGDRDAALVDLARAVAKDGLRLKILAPRDPDLATLRGDPRFEALVGPHP
jgi:hypothetical protein